MKPWRRSWRATGSFALVSPLARAVFREVFTELVEDDGTITLNGRPLADEVCRRLGVQRHDRRIFRRCLDELVVDGCIAVSGGVATLPGWRRYQASGKPLPRSDGPLTDLCVTPDGPLPRSDGPLTDLCVTSGCASDTPKSAESFNTASTEEKRVEESREDKNRGEKSREPDRSPIARGAQLVRALEVALQTSLGYAPELAHNARKADALLGKHPGIDWHREVEAFAAAVAAMPESRRPKVEYTWLRFLDKIGRWTKAAPGRGVARARSHEEFEDTNLDEVFAAFGGERA